MPTPKRKELEEHKWGQGKRRTSHEYTLYTVLQFKIILPNKRIIHLLKTYPVHADLLSSPTNTSGTFHFSMNTLGIYQFSLINLQQWITRDLKLSVEAGSCGLKLNLLFWLNTGWVCICPSLGDPLNPGIETGTPAFRVSSLPPEPPGNQDSYTFLPHHLEPAEISIVNFQPPF